MLAASAMNPKIVSLGLSSLILSTACASTGVATIPQSGAGVADIDPTASAPSPQPGVVRLHVLADDPHVEVRGPRSGTPTYHGGVATRLEEGVVCRAPCGSVVDGRAGQELYFGGPDVTSSSRFQLLDKKGDQWVSVDSGSSDLRMGGFAMLALGAGPVAVAAALLPWWNVAYPEGLPSSTTAGVALSFSLGGAAIISGLAMIGASRTTFEFVERDRAIGRARRD